MGLFLWVVTHITRQVEIASFTTDISGRSANQLENLKIATGKVDGTIIKPKETFSFNAVVGERLKRWGYRGAPTIYEGQILDTPGGGLCQFSSTIYNTALLSGMEILERSPHLWLIRSVGPGRDSAILYDQIDLKFRNTLPFNVEIRTEISRGLLTVKFIGPGEPDFKCHVTVETLQVYDPGNSKPSISKISDGKAGVKVKVLRTFEKNDQQPFTEVVSVDRYRPIPGNADPDRY